MKPWESVKIGPRGNKLIVTSLLLLHTCTEDKEGEKEAGGRHGNSKVTSLFIIPVATSRQVSSERLMQTS